MDEDIVATYEYVASRFSYDPDTGIVTNKATGRPSGTKSAGGYLLMQVGKKFVSVHRVAYMLMMGHQPAEFLDHVNGQRDDNRWCNIRTATATQNAQNKKPYGVVNHGYKGAHLDRNGKWKAVVHVDGKTRPIPGTYDSAEQANKAYAHWAKKHFGQYTRLLGPTVGKRVPQDDKVRAAGHFAEMLVRRASVAQQLADLNGAIAAFEKQASPAVVAEAKSIADATLLREKATRDEADKRKLERKRRRQEQLRSGLSRLAAINDKSPLQ